MKDDRNFVGLIQKGVRITVGATTSLVETLQNPQKRTEAVDLLQTELARKYSNRMYKG
jgi:hypothetical protein